MKLKLLAETCGCVRDHDSELHGHEYILIPKYTICVCIWAKTKAERQRDGQMIGDD